MTPAIEQGKLNQLVGQILNDLGGAASVAMVRMGDALGLYKTLHEKGSMTSEELAKAAGAHERYVREWLAHQAASNYLPMIKLMASSHCRQSRPCCSRSKIVP